ncbi:P-type conjugative transfer protein TrbL [Inquilinus limosus]|uniref:P-type conjugative transfer protein TrbL n=1 Tax=Inquilinus limosus TaxID=171674 RepID=UPI003F179ED4
MNDLGIIDRFMQTFIRYIDGGFGLLNGDVVALTTILVGIDMTLAGLFWALDPEGDVLVRLIRKTLYVGAFAFIIGNFQSLATIVFDSFSTLGLNATATGLTAGDLLKPGRLAATGFEAAWPLLQQAGSLIGVTSFFTHFVTIMVLLLAWFIVIITFFVLAVQLFITVLEFKLTTLAGFVLVPFALWNRTAFLAERVLGNVISSGIKVMVLAVIVGIGSTLFGSFTDTSPGQEPSLAGAMALVLAAITLFGLGIFGPAIATGLVSGAPQLGAGAAVGTAGAVAGTVMIAGGAAAGGARLIGAAGSGGLAAIRAGTAIGSAAAGAYELGQATSGASGLAGAAAGLGGVTRAGIGAVARSARSSLAPLGNALADGVEAGRQGTWRATGGEGTGTTAPSTASAGQAVPPGWARRLQAEQRARHRRQVTAQAIREGDRPGAPANPELDEED